VGQSGCVTAYQDITPAEQTVEDAGSPPAIARTWPLLTIKRCAAKRCPAPEQQRMPRRAAPPIRRP
jgi:hypothetical protein